MWNVNKIADDRSQIIRDWGEYKDKERNLVYSLRSLLPQGRREGRDLFI